MDELCIGEMPEVDCPLSYRAKHVPLTECIGKCHEPCVRFWGFRFVMDACVDEVCTYGAPCLMCLERIEDMKILIKTLNAVIGPQKLGTKNIKWSAKRSKLDKQLRG